MATRQRRWRLPMKKRCLLKASLVYQRSGIAVFSYAEFAPMVGRQGGELKEQAYSHVIGLYECRGLLSMAFPSTVSNLCGEDRYVFLN
jgi:hypothetical protein